MSDTISWPKPPRLIETDDPSKIVRWHLRLVLACTPGGSATELANLIGVTPNTIYLAVHRGQCTDDLAKRIEKLFGREYFPRELFVPEPKLPGE